MVIYGRFEGLSGEDQVIDLARKRAGFEVRAVEVVAKIL
jgi:hypothetical protein